MRSWRNTSRRDPAETSVGLQLQLLSLSPENYYKAAAVIKEMSREDYKNPDHVIFIKLAELLMTLLKTQSSTRLRPQKQRDQYPQDGRQCDLPR